MSCKRRLKNRGGSIEELYRRRMKSALTSNHMVIHNEAERKAKRIILKFLRESGPATEMKQKMLEVYWKFIKI